MKDFEPKNEGKVRRLETAARCGGFVNPIGGFVCEWLQENARALSEIGHIIGAEQVMDRIAQRRKDQIREIVGLPTESPYADPNK